MKISKDFSICVVAGRTFLAPLGSQTIDMKKMIDLNGSARMLVEALQENDCTKEELLEKILSRYEIDEATASAGLDEFIGKAKQIGIIEE